MTSDTPSWVHVINYEKQRYSNNSEECEKGDPSYCQNENVKNKNKNKALVGAQRVSLSTLSYQLYCQLSPSFNAEENTAAISRPIT